MIRHSIAALTVGALVAGVGAVPSGGQLFAQSDDEQPPAAEEQALAPAAVQLDLGERLSTPAWDLEAQSVFRAPNRDLVEKTEVRIAVALRNNLDAAVPLSDSSFLFDPSFPRFALVDGAGIERPLLGVRMRNDVVGQYDLRDLAPGMTARWTIGFRIPADAADDLELVARDAQGVDLAVWDVEDRGMRAGWDPPADAEPLAFGETILWDEDGIEATAIEHGTLVCGNPNVEYVTQVFAVRFDVGNRNFADDLIWPGSSFPATAAVARWSDGAAAAVTSETFSGPEDLLRKVFTDQIEVPSTEEPDFGRALLFGVPRDGRLGSVADAPDGVLLNLPDRTRRWLDITGPATLPMNPALCDVGFFEFTIPYAFGPSHGFDVARVALPEDPVAQDREARELLTQALVNASVYYLGNGSYGGVTSAVLEDIWGSVDFTNAESRVRPGVVAWEVPVEDEDLQQIVLVTRSASGLYFCAINEATVATRFAEAEDLAAIIDACAPILPAAEVPAEGEATTTTTTTTTTVAP